MRTIFGGEAKHQSFFKEDATSRTRTPDTKSPHSTVVTLRDCTSATQHTLKHPSAKGIQETTRNRIFEENGFPKRK